MAKKQTTTIMLVVLVTAAIAGVVYFIMGRKGQKKVTFNETSMVMDTASKPASKPQMAEPEPEVANGGNGGLATGEMNGTGASSMPTMAPTALPQLELPVGDDEERLYIAPSHTIGINTRDGRVKNVDIRGTKTVNQDNPGPIWNLAPNRLPIAGGRDQMVV